MFNKNKKSPEICIMPYYLHVIEKLVHKGILKELIRETSQVSPPLPLYEMKHKNKRIAVMTPGLGAPFAVGMLEFAIANGCQKFIIIGSCGVLDKSIKRDQIIIPSSAIRDEGTSYHYLPPAREIEQENEMVELLKKYLTKKSIAFTIGKTWTIDAFYRETPQKIKLRKKEGAIAVEMEAAALMSVAKFREVKLDYLLAAGDDISGLNWEHRHWNKSKIFFEKFFWLAADFCITL